jgi:hypothetical protein
MGSFGGPVKKLFICFLLLLPLSSHALFEIRAGYGTNKMDEDTYAGFEVDDMTGFNLDAIFEPPMITDMGFGLRYEKMKFDIGTSEAELERIAAIINYRFIDLITYFGLIGTVGLSNDFKIDSDTDFDPKLNYSIGVEAGVSLGLIMVGAEVGKFFGEVENPGSPDIDISGIYAKALVGFGF